MSEINQPDEYEFNPETQKGRQGPQSLQQVRVVAPRFCESRTQLSVAQGP